MNATVAWRRTSSAPMAAHLDAYVADRRNVVGNALNLNAGR